jgi:hypothetical protein
MKYFTKLTGTLAALGLAFVLAGCDQPTDSGGGDPPAFVAVTNITGVPADALVGTDLRLTGTVVPADATNKAIVWSVKAAGVFVLTTYRTPSAYGMDNPRLAQN